MHPLQLKLPSEVFEAIFCIKRCLGNQNPMRFASNMQKSPNNAKYIFTPKIKTFIKHSEVKAQRTEKR